MNRIFVALTRSLSLALVATVLLSPSESQAAASTYSRNYVQKAYVAYYGRPADPAGQEYWASRMDAAGGSLNAIIAAFGNSAEFNSRYGGMSNSALVTKIYQQALSRNPDPAGLNYYVNELQAGRKTLQTITLDVLNGASTEPDSIVVDNKLLVAAYYTSRVAGGCAYGTEQDGVNNIAGVNADMPTVVAAANGVDSRCGPSVGASSQGIWGGRTSANAEMQGTILDTGDYYLLYSAPGGGEPAGFIQGTVGGTNGRNFKITPGPGSANPITFSIGYAPKVYVQGSFVELGVTTSFTVLYDPYEVEQVANLAAAAGTYLVQLGTPVSGFQAGTMTLSSSGALSGSASGCAYSGTIAPRGSTSVFDLTLRFDSANCVFGTGTFSGIAHYDPSDRLFLGAAPNAARTSGVMFYGQK